MNHYFYKTINGFVFLFLLSFLLSCSPPERRVLVFSKTKGWYHESIPAGIKAVMELGKENNFIVDTTKDAALFNEKNLEKYDAVIFLNTTGNVLNAEQQVAFERYIQSGGGYAGIHSSADTEYEWPWYNQLVGAYFLSHPNNPNVRKATVYVTDSLHESTKGLPSRWERSDEWYNYKNINGSVNVVAWLDESSYEGGEHQDEHQIAWYHDYDGGRAFYTGGGHTIESYSEPLFRKHILGGIQYAMGKNVKRDYKKAYSVRSPEDNRFTKEILSNDLNEPMEMAVADNGSVYFIERSGNFYHYDPATKSTNLVHRFQVLRDTKEGMGNGLLGITLDPGFAKNRFIYFFYTPDKKPVAQNISRFILTTGGKLDLASEKVIIQVPLELEVSAHTGGSMAWDTHGNLFISTGDNTVPFESDGFAPIDERAGRTIFDAQRSSANTNDLRGKILRIHPEEDGSYTIPDGNLFPQGKEGTRPEIFVMGCRNPYRISIDQKTGILYWGEIGPDSGEDGVQGPKGYDEINQASKSGNYGWPYFVGNNIPYVEYDFETKSAGSMYDASGPSNNSPNNTGLKELPPAEAAMIWYPYDKSPEYPTVGVGGRSAMAGPVFHYDNTIKTKGQLPEYFNNGLFIFDWMRNWVFVARLDNENKFSRLEPFMALNGDFRRPIDMETGQDGTLYILEYGSVYGIDNVDARLVKISYNDGNRAPVARITANDSVGQKPLQLKLNSKKSIDPDEKDALKINWTVEGKQLNGEELNYTFQNEGVFPVVLSVTDPSGVSHSDTLKIYVGNTLPDVAFETEHNPGFFFPGQRMEYSIKVNDKEDKKVNADRIVVSKSYIADANPLKRGHQSLEQYVPGKSLMAMSDCKACHQIAKRSVGPAFQDVAKRYKNDRGAVDRLVSKIIKGGGGIWGEHAMNAHPQLSVDDAREMVTYILSLSGKPGEGDLPVNGVINFDQHQPGNTQARFILKASYTDGGGSSKPLRRETVMILRPSRVEAEYADNMKGAWHDGDKLTGLGNKSWFAFKGVDLKSVKNVTYRYSSSADAVVEIRSGSIYGPVISTLGIKTTQKDQFSEASTPIQDPGGKQDLYIMIKREQEPKYGFIAMDWVEFKIK